MFESFTSNVKIFWLIKHTISPFEMNSSKEIVLEKVNICIQATVRNAVSFFNYIF